MGVELGNTEIAFYYYTTSIVNTLTGETVQGFHKEIADMGLVLDLSWREIRNYVQFCEVKVVDTFHSEAL